MVNLNLTTYDHNVKDLTGQAFGRLTVLKRHGTNKRRQATWFCACCCGNIIVAVGTKLTYGDKKSCGCLQKENVPKPVLKHGMYKIPEYRVWLSMLDRCRNVKCRGYKNYGGRGISVCKSWLEFKNFFADMGRRTSPKHTIERIDNNGDYSPENCRWASRSDQGRNRRNNRLITYQGKTKPLIEWAEACNISFNALVYRLNAKWPLERALREPSARPKLIVEE